MKSDFFFAIISFYLNAGLFYCADVLQKITSEKRWTWSYLTVRTSYTFVIALFVTILYAGFEHFPNPSTALQISGCSLICGGGLFFYIRAVNHLKFSNAGSLYIIGQVIQVAFGTLLQNDPFYINDLPALLLMSTGCIYQIFTGTSFKGALSVLISSICWTLGYILLSFPLKNNTNVFWSIPIMEGTILIVCLVVILFTRKQHNKDFSEIVKTTNHWRFPAIAILVTAGSYFNHISFRDNPLSFISILQLSLAPITLFISLRIFREKLTKIEWISFVTGFTGFGLFILNRI
jgi:EamA domain-containing membrane protein RarD